MTSTQIGLTFGKYLILEYNKEKEMYLVACECGTRKYLKIGGIKRNKGGCLSCSRKITRRYKQKRKNTTAKDVSDYNSILKLYRSYKFSATDRNLLFELDLTTFKKIINSKCHYCDLDKSNTMKHKSPLIEPFMYNGIDRKDNSVGYVQENVVPCCKYCNYMKGKMGYADFLKQVYIISKRFFFIN